MKDLQQDVFEKQLLDIAGSMEYPRTPDIAGAVMRRLAQRRAAPEVEAAKGGRGDGGFRFLSRRIALSVTILLVLCISLMLIPPARAAILEFIQIGVVRIFRTDPAPQAPLPPPTAQFPITELPLTATPSAPSSSLVPLLQNIAGETTLAEAQKKVKYPILLPAYPSDLGQPDYVFVQEVNGAMTVLVWADPDQRGHIRMSLHFVPAGSWAIKKIEPTQIQETDVNGQRAIWAVGPYPLQMSNGNFDIRRLVDGHVLIWTQGDITYRLETDASLKEAIKIAESLHPIKP